MGFKFGIQIDQASFIDWISILSFNLIEEISLNPADVSADH